MVHKKTIMLVISSREFRANQKKYFDIIDNDGTVIIQRGKDKAYLLTTVKDLDIYFSKPEIIEKMKKAIDEVEHGNVLKIDKGDIKELLGL